MPPKWGEHFISTRIVKIIEESVVDPKEKTLITYTRNIGYTSVMVRFVSTIIYMFLCVCIYLWIIYISLHIKHGWRKVWKYLCSVYFIAFYKVCIMLKSSVAFKIKFWKFKIFTCFGFNRTEILKHFQPCILQKTASLHGSYLCVIFTKNFKLITFLLLLFNPVVTVFCIMLP